MAHLAGLEPARVGLIRQDQHGVNFQGKPLSCLMYCSLKTIDVRDLHAAVAVEQIDRGHVAATCDEHTTIVGHLRQ